MTIDEVTAQELDRAVIDLCRQTFQQGKTFMQDRERFALLCSRSPEFMEWAHMTALRMPGTTGTEFAAVLTVVCSAMSVGVEIGLALAAEKVK